MQVTISVSAKRMGEKRMGAKRMEVKTPVLTVLHDTKGEATLAHGGEFSNLTALHKVSKRSMQKPQ